MNSEEKTYGQMLGELFAIPLEDIENIPDFLNDKQAEELINDTRFLGLWFEYMRKSIKQCQEQGMSFFPEAVALHFGFDCGRLWQRYKSIQK